MLRFAQANGHAPFAVRGQPVALARRQLALGTLPLREPMAERLRILLERHHLYTGSKRARAILDDWPNALGKFVKIMPKDYKRALKQLEAERLAAAHVAAE